MKRLMTMVALVVAVTMGAVFAAPSAGAAPPDRSALAGLDNIPVTGVLDGTTTPISGVLAITGVNPGHRTVTGTFTPTDGPMAGRTDTFVADIQQLVDPPGSCQILDLVLGPLHLDLLGLVVDLNQVHLTITAQRGPGNLLGNLLCAVAGLLNP